MTTVAQDQRRLTPSSGSVLNAYSPTHQCLLAEEILADPDLREAISFDPAQALKSA